MKALGSQVCDGEDLALTLMSWMGRGTLPWPVNGELGDLGPLVPPFGEQFRFLRCDAQLEPEWLAGMGLDISAARAKALRDLGAAANIPQLYDIGRRAAERQITRQVLEGW